MKNIFTEWFRNLSRTETALHDIHRLDNKTTKIDQRVENLVEENEELRREIEKLWDFIRATVDYLHVDVTKTRDEQPNWSVFPRERTKFVKRSK